MDSDQAKLGTCLCGYAVQSPESVHALQFDYALVATVHFDQVRERLRQLGVENDRIIQAITAPVAGKHPSVSSQAWKYRPLVSVIMPARNREATIRRALGSVLQQSYENFELLVVDNGSSDNTAAEAKNAAGDDGRVIHLSERRPGVSAARNRALAEAKGELFAYLDSDNRWHPDYLLQMTARFAQGAFDSGYCGMQFFHMPEGIIRLWTPAYDREQLEQMNFIDLNVFMHRRSLYGKCGGFDESLNRLVDWDLVLRYTRNKPPFFLRAALADYLIENGADRISNSAPFYENYERLSALHSLNSEPIANRGFP